MHGPIIFRLSALLVLHSGEKADGCWEFNHALQKTENVVHAGPQELIDEAWWASSSAQQEHAASMGEDFHGQDSQLSTQMPQAPLPPHLSVPENWDQQLGQLGSEFGEEFDQAQPKAARKRSADRQLYADAGADVEAPAPKQARPSPAAPLAAPPHLLEEDHSVLLQPVITDSSSAKAGARPPWPLPGPSPRKPAGPLSAPQLGKAAWPAGQPDSGSRALPRSASANGLRPASADRSRDPDSQRSLPNGAAAQQGGQKADGMSGYGPAFLEKAIGVFEEGQVSVNGKILKKLIPGMDPAEAYVGLGWAGWALAQYTTPATQLQVCSQLGSEAIAQPLLCCPESCTPCLPCLPLCLVFCQLDALYTAAGNSASALMHSCVSLSTPLPQNTAWQAADSLKLWRRQARCWITWETSSRAWPARAPQAAHPQLQSDRGVHLESIQRRGSVPPTGQKYQGYMQPIWIVTLIQKTLRLPAEHVNAVSAAINNMQALHRHSLPILTP